MSSTVRVNLKLRGKLGLMCRAWWSKLSNIFCYKSTSWFFCRLFYEFRLFSAVGKMLQNLKIVYNLTRLVSNSYRKRFVRLFSVLSHLVTTNKRAVLLSGCRTLMAQTKQRRIKLEENNRGLLLLITVANSNSLCHRSKAAGISSSRLEHCDDRFFYDRCKSSKRWDELLSCLL